MLQIINGDMAMSSESDGLSARNVGIGLTAQSIILGVIPVTFVVLAMCSAIFIGFARMDAVPRIVEPPSNLLPGNFLPEAIPCGTTYARRFECLTVHEGEVIYFDVDTSTGEILHETITAHRQTIGKLLTAWGIPTGLTRIGLAVYVFWGDRWAYLYTCSFEPGTPVGFIGYDLAGSPSAQQAELPWRGFTHVDGYRCAKKLNFP